VNSERRTAGCAYQDLPHEIEAFLFAALLSKSMPKDRWSADSSTDFGNGLIACLKTTKSLK